MDDTRTLLGTDAPLIGMIHVLALPGTPRHSTSMNAIVEQAVADATTLIDGGFDALLIENMHDVPYLRRDVGPEIIAGMTRVALAVRAITDRPIGIQILAGANHQALAVAHVAGLNFVRVEGFTFASVADEGLLEEADAGPLLRYRRQIGAESIQIFADIKKKHSAHAITADVNLAQSAHAAEFCGADGVIVSGAATGQPTAMEDLHAVRAATSLPVIVGSGVRPENGASCRKNSDGMIIGSWYKQDGRWERPVDPERVALIVNAIRTP